MTHADITPEQCRILLERAQAENQWLRTQLRLQARYYARSHPEIPPCEPTEVDPGTGQGPAAP